MKKNTKNTSDKEYLNFNVAHNGVWHLNKFNCYQICLNATFASFFFNVSSHSNHLNF